MSSREPSSPKFRLRLLPVLIAAAVTSQAHAADLWTITQDALQNNSTLGASRSTFQSVEAGRDVARGSLLPQIDATAQVAHNNTLESQSSSSALGGAGTGGTGTGSESSYNSTSAGIELTQALYDATSWAELEIAKRETGQQALLLQADRQQLLYDVASAYFEILRANDVLEASISQEKAIKRQLDQAQEQFDVGLVATTDVNEAQASYDLARSQRISAENDLQVSFEALERLTGKRYDSIDALSDDIPIESPEPAGRDNWIQMAIANNPNVQAAQAAVDVSQAEVEQAEAGHKPTLSAFANYNYSDSDQDYLDGHNTDTQVGLQASLPIYSGGTTSAQVRQQTYSLEATQYDFEAQRRDTTQQVRSLFTQVMNDVESVEAQRQAIVSNRSALEATRSGYEVGTRNIVDVLDAEQALYQAVSDYADARYTYVTDMVELRQQAGVLDQDVIRDLNQWLRETETVTLRLPEDGGMSQMEDIGERPTMEQSSAP
ncbi:TolC family outer membrane protein [Chromohalobacter sp. TMW 2.2308]|uniref:Outer membrane protein n=1 Tax=Chromohalobacter canadensis TaxID=141389 RepID=A0A285VFR9_9GAMM|nr:MULTISPECIES: TolC family outer membrane protein [Chromohalobacter]MCK2042835.1 TolC family outer membrane protein [Chromohalobacter moromii]MCT8514645.1 TolC family outer membrane protein [Chromohalobacter sp. TMW 2.2271]CDQ35084.1 Outer membrane protein TolC precursor [Virgibacillus halodenitrificans]SOC52920.1 outer membrane protein [Chromohalobacter canadensis]